MKFVRRRDKAFRRLYVLGALAAFVSLAGWNTLLLREDGWWPVLGLLATAAAYAATVPASREANMASFGAGWVGAYTATERQLTRRTANSTTTWSWLAFRDVELTDTHLLLRVAGTSHLVIPRRCFTKHMDAERLVAWARGV